MFRKLITLTLFTVSVSLAVFGQDAFSAENVKTMLSDMGHRAYEHWPEAQKKIQKSLPTATKGLASQLNDFSPSAGTPSNMCIAAAIWQENDNNSKNMI